MKREVIVSSAAFSEDGVELAYMVVPEDVRSEGHVVLSRTAAISYEAPGALGAGATDLRTAVVALAEQLLAQLPELPEYQPPAAEPLAFDVGDDDEDVGMGDGR